MKYSYIWKPITDLSDGNTIVLHQPTRLVKIKSIDFKTENLKQKIVITMIEIDSGKTIIQQHNTETDQYRFSIN